MNLRVADSSSVVCFCLSRRVKRVEDARVVRWGGFSLSHSHHPLCLNSLPRVLPRPFADGVQKIGSLNYYDGEGSKNITKKMNLRPFKLYRVYLEPLSSSNVGDFSWS